MLTKTGRYIFLGICLSTAMAVALAVLLYRARHCRTVTLSHLNNGETQTVSVAFRPDFMEWKISGNVKGTGVVMLADMQIAPIGPVISSTLLSNRVSGSFSVRSGRDYYSSNVSVIFIPEGSAAGKIRASLRLF